MNNDIQIILGNSNKRFSGVTSTMLQVLEKQKSLAGVAVLGPHHLPDDAAVLTFFGLLKLCKNTLPDGRYRVFHARRNDEMIQAIIARALGAKIKILQSQGWDFWFNNSCPDVCASIKRRINIIIL